MALGLFSHRSFRVVHHGTPEYPEIGNTFNGSCLSIFLLDLGE